MKNLCVDVETTGLIPRGASITDPKMPRIVQISWCLREEKLELSRNNFIIKPLGFVIPKEAIKIHKITNEIANEKGVQLILVLRKLEKDIELCDYIIGHNISFDYDVICSELFKQGLDYNKLLNKKRYCTQKGSTEYCKIPHPTGSWNYKYPSLNELYFKLFNESPKALHDAEQDVNTCIRCFDELRNRKVIIV